MAFRSKTDVSLCPTCCNGNSMAALPAQLLGQHERVSVSRYLSAILRLQWAIDETRKLGLGPSPIVNAKRWKVNRHFGSFAGGRNRVRSSARYPTGESPPAVSEDS